MAKEHTTTTSKWNIAAALAAWLLPGLGHFLLGQRKRGIILFISIGLMWAFGLGLGGISVIDRANHPAWFVGQMFVGPSVVVNYYHTSLRQRIGGEPQPKLGATSPEPVYIPSFGRLHEEGTLFVALAGMLNILAILDVMYRDPQKSRHRDDPSKADPKPATP